MIPERWTKEITDYLYGNRLVRWKQVQTKDDYAPYLAIITGKPGPQGKTTLQNLLEANGWEVRNAVDCTNGAETPKNPLQKMPRKKNVFIFDFGNEFFTHEEMVEYRNTHKN